MSFIKVYIHFVWGTKNREPFLADAKMRYLVWKHIRENAREKDIHVDFVNGYVDHCHCLVSMKYDQSIQQVMNLIKGESSHWINHCDLFLPYLDGQIFEWQDEYYAVSVSESMIETVRNYIRNQMEHHKNKSFVEECKEFVDKYGFAKLTDMK